MNYPRRSNTTFAIRESPRNKVAMRAGRLMLSQLDSFSERWLNVYRQAPARYSEK
jgi:hypothetical protein